MLIEKIRADWLAARKARQSVESTLLGVLVGAIQTKEKTFNPERSLSDDEVVAQIKKLLDGLHETVKITQERTPDRVSDIEKAKVEIACLSVYIPKQLTEAEIETFLRNSMAQGVAGIGPLLASLKAYAPGAYDGKLASSIAKRVISEGV